MTDHANSKPRRSQVSLPFHQDDRNETIRLQEDTARLASFPMMNPNPVLEVDQEGHVLFANPSSEQLFPDLVQRGAGHPWLQDWSSTVRACMASAGGLFHRDVKVGQRWYRQSMHYVPTEERIRIYGSDITERKQAEESLHRLNAELEDRVAGQTEEIRKTYDAVKAERQRLYDVLETLPVYVILLTKDHRVPFANRFFRERFGESQGKRCYEYLFNRVEPCEICDTYKVLETNAPHHWEWMGPDKRNYDIHDFPFMDADGSMMIMEVGIDITEAKKAQAALRQANETLELRVAERTDELTAASDKLRESEERVRRKLDSILSPKGDMGELVLEDIIDVPAVQALMDNFYKLARIPMAIIDLNGKVLVGIGWQAICTKFHRVHPKTCQYCVESDLQLSEGVAPGESRLYKCKNNMWDMSTPILVGGQKVGNLFCGQFFFKDESPDRELFRAQARRYGFDEQEYLAALDRVPRLNREELQTGMAYFVKLADMISKLSYSNITLARLLTERDALTGSLRESEQRLSRAEGIAHLGSWELDLTGNKLSWSDEVYRIFGFRPQEFGATYEAFLEAVHPDDRAMVDAAYSGSLRDGRNTYEIEHRIVQKGSGEIRWVDEKCAHERDSTGKIIRSTGMVLDITTRKQAEAVLKQSHEELEALVEARTATVVEQSRLLDAFFQHSITPLVFLDRDFNFIRVNEAYAQSCQKAVSEFKGHNHFEFFPNEENRQIFEQVVRTREPFQVFAKPFVFQDHPEWGVTYWDWVLIPLLDHAGEVEFLVFSLQDVTERKKQENKIRMTNILLELFSSKSSRKEYLDSVVSLFRVWLDTRCAGIRVVADDGTIPYESYVGFTKEFWKSENSICLSKDPCACTRVIASQPESQDLPLMTGKGSFSCGTLARFVAGLPDEEKCHYRGVCVRHGFNSITVVPIRYGDRVVGAIHLADERENHFPRDSVEFVEMLTPSIGEALHRFSIEDALKGSEEKYRELVENANSIILRLDVQGRIVFINEYAQRFFGYDEAELLGRDVVGTIVPEIESTGRDLRALMNEVHRHPDDYSSNVNENIKKDGTRVWLAWTNKSACDENGRLVHILCVGLDITERRRLEEERQRLADQLIAIQEEERKNISSMLHDHMGQLLTVARLDLESLKVSDAAARKTIANVLGWLKEMIGTVRDLAATLRPPLLDDMSVATALESLVDNFRKGSHLEVTFKAGENMPDVDIEIKTCLYRILQEALTNVGKHAFATRVEVSLAGDDGLVRLQVRDNGAGFDPSKKKDGLGIGLVSMRERARQLNGRFTVQSDVKKGTVIVTEILLEEKRTAS